MLKFIIIFLGGGKAQSEERSHVWVLLIIDEVEANALNKYLLSVSENICISRYTKHVNVISDNIKTLNYLMICIMHLKSHL
jgi:hypothetical protein